MRRVRGGTCGLKESMSSIVSGKAISQHRSDVPCCIGNAGESDASMSYGSDKVKLVGACKRSNLSGLIFFESLLLRHYSSGESQVTDVDYSLGRLNQLSGEGWSNRGPYAEDPSVGQITTLSTPNKKKKEVNPRYASWVVINK